jgi:hypothetical protein
MTRHHHEDVLHDASHHLAIYRRAVAAVFAQTYEGNRLEAESLLAEADCLVCVTRCLSGLVARLDGDAYAVGTRIAASEELVVLLGAEPPDYWDAEAPVAPDDFGLLP